MFYKCLLVLKDQIKVSNNWDLFINILGIVGIAFLSVPAWYANKYGMILAKLTSSQPHSRSLLEKQEKLAEDLEKLKDLWTPWKSRMLIYGTFLTAASYFFGILKAILI